MRHLGIVSVPGTERGGGGSAMNGTRDGDGLCRCDNKIFGKNFFNMN